MEKHSPSTILSGAVAAGLDKVQESFGPSEDERMAKILRRPTDRRLRRIEVFRAAIGKGHRAILEMGCGAGDLTWSLADSTEKIVGIDVSQHALMAAKLRERLWPLTPEQAAKVEFREMSALQLDFPNGAFDYAISTSMVEHLQPDELPGHFKEVRRVLRPGGKYLIWCPNGLGHHSDREVHFSMRSYAQWIELMSQAGFHDFVSTRTTGMPLVPAQRKVLLEKLLSTLHIRILWSHLGVRNVFLIGTC